MWKWIRRLIAKIFGFKDDTEEVCETTLLSNEELEAIRKDAEKDAERNFWGEA